MDGVCEEGGVTLEIKNLLTIIIWVAAKDGFKI